MQAQLIRAMAFLAFSFGVTSALYAVPITYTDRAAFDAAIAALTNPTGSTLDFDALPANSLIADGGSVGGLTFNYPVLDSFGVSMQVSSGFDTTSSTNYLGTNDGGVFLDGDNFSLDFGAVNAIGMYFITGDPMFDGDISLTAGGATASLAAGAIQQALPDGGNAFFLGILDDAATFSSAAVDTIGLGAFLYNVDDIVTAKANPPVVGVPEPATLALFALGLLGFGMRRRMMLG